MPAAESSVCPLLRAAGARVTQQHVRPHLIGTDSTNAAAFQGAIQGATLNLASRSPTRPRRLTPCDNESFEGAGNGIRTHDLQHGKLPLYH